jgi:hypothetical protein
MEFQQGVFNLEVFGIEERLFLSQKKSLIK